MSFDPDPGDFDGTGRPNSEPEPVPGNSAGEFSDVADFDRPLDVTDPPPTPASQPVDEQLGRLHPMSLLFDIASHIRTLIIPAVIAVLSAASGSSYGMVFAALVFIPAIAISVVRYFSLRYRIHDHELIVTEGIFFRRMRTVPVKRIQNVDLVQNIMHRLFKVAEVRIETASGTEPEATLRVLGMHEVEELREGIFKERSEPQSEGLPDSESAELADPIVPAMQRESLLTIPTSQLIRAGLASNRGMLLLGVLVGIYFQFDEQIEASFDFEAWVNSLADQTSGLWFYYIVAAGILAIVLLFRLLGIVWYLLRFHGYELTRRGEDLRIQCGLLTKISATVPRPRIQFINIHQNLIMRWMGLASIRIETAGGSGAGQEDAAKSVSSRWFVPVLPESEVAELIGELKPGLKWQPDQLDWQSISPRAPARMTRLAIIASIVVAGAGFAATRPWGWAFGVAAMPLFIWVAIKKSRARRYARTGEFVTYRSGIFTRRTSLTFFEKIQTVRVDESPFDRRWEMASLCIDTAAAGPAEHRIHIDYLTADFARAEFDAIVRQASGHQPVFG